MTPLKAIIQVTGAFGSGKTSVVLALGAELPTASILYIDASADQRLTISMAPNPTGFTLADLLNQTSNAEGNASKEALDWAFSDLVISVGDEQDLLTVGNLKAEWPAEVLGKLRYGLTRLLSHYDYVLVDGFHPLVQDALPEPLLHQLEVLAPKDFAQWALSESVDLAQTPSLILNDYSDEPFPSALEEALDQGKIQLIGKLPHYSSQEQKLRCFPEAFHNCLLRLNVPFSLNSH